jgi:hypothetical protein
MNQLKQNIWASIFIIYTRYLIGGAFVFASLLKIKGKPFISASGANEPIHSINHFFETMYQSGIYWQFIGWGQFIAGGLLMTQRFAKLGALANFPIILNIFVITISYDFSGTPIITGLILLANLMLLLWDWNETRIFFNLPPISDPPKMPLKNIIWEITGWILFLFTAIYRVLVDYYDVMFWFSTCVAVGFIGFLIGIWQFFKKNTPLSILN